MKLKKKAFSVRKESSGLLKKFQTGQVEIKITKLIEELFPLLIGMELYFGVSAQQYVKNLKLPNEELVVEILLKSGYIAGIPENWKLSESVLNAVAKRLSTIGDNRSRIGYERLLPLEPVQAAPGVAELVKTYRKGLKRVPPAHREQRVTNMFVFFRKLSRELDTTFILDQMKRFFDYMAFGSNDYRLETFAKYVRSVHENR